MDGTDTKRDVRARETASSTEVEGDRTEVPDDLTQMEDSLVDPLAPLQMESDGSHTKTDPAPGGGDSVQMIGDELVEDGGTKKTGDEVPHYGEDDDQRRYTPEEYIALWEEDQGTKMSAEQIQTIRRGCIGITAANLTGGGNPIDAAESIYGTFDAANAALEEKNELINTIGSVGDWAADLASMFGAKRYVMFAKLFWSNQGDPTSTESDPDAFPEDPKTHEIDLDDFKKNYDYNAQPKPGGGGYVNFDYGFWDATTKSFWHANHMEYDDPVKAKADPMKVYQSTKDKFTAGYMDFDRILFGIAPVEAYDPVTSAKKHV